MSYNNGYDDDDDFLEERSRFLTWIGPAIVVLALIAGGWFVFRAVSDDSKTDARTVALEEGAASSTTASAPRTTVEARATTSSRAATTSTAGTSTTSGSEAASTTAAAATSTVAAVAPVVNDSTTTNPTVASAGPDPTPTSTSAPATETTTAPVVNTLPDGSFPPVVAVFDADTITISGVVPSQAARERLEALAVANSKTPATVSNLLTIDPSVPAGVGARIIELNSVRFPSGSAEVLPEHALELNRIAAIMSALPNITTLVVGHADQVGSADANFALSEARARNVVTYLVSQGIAPARLSSRAVGDQDLLSVNDDATSLALNRRTEFIIYGLLIG